MYVSTGCTDVVKRGHFWLGIDQRGCRSSKGVDYDILAQGINRIDRILIPSKYTFFSEAQLQRTLELSMFGTEQF
jgi:hypothetical protein